MTRCAAIVLALLVSLSGCSDSTGSTPTPAASPSAAAPSGGPDPMRGKALVEKRECNNVCHKPNNVVKAPLLDEAVKARVPLVDGYAAYAERLKVTDRARYDSAGGRIDRILNTPAGDARLALWLRSYLQDPTFDDGGKRMLEPAPPLTEAELDHIVAYLLTLK